MIEMRIATYDRDHRRLWVGRARVHHGFIGVICTLTGVALMIHDWRDHREWLTALLSHH